MPDHQHSTSTHHTVVTPPPIAPGIRIGNVYTGPTSVHARFRLDEDKRVYSYAGEGKHVPALHIKLGAVQGEPFGSASPSGSMEITIANPDAAAMFKYAELGQEFDVIISPVVHTIEHHEETK